MRSRIKVVSGRMKRRTLIESEYTTTRGDLEGRELVLRSESSKAPAVGAMKWKMPSPVRASLCNLRCCCQTAIRTHFLRLHITSLTSATTAGISADQRTCRRGQTLRALARRDSQQHQGSPPAIHGRDSTTNGAASPMESMLMTDSEAWRYSGPFTRFQRFRGAFPGLGIATVAFAGYLAYEQAFLKDDHGHGHGEGHESGHH